MGTTGCLEKSIRLYEKMKDLALKQQSSFVENRMDSFLQLARERDLLRSQIELHEKKTGIPAREAIEQPGPASQMVRRKMEIIRSILETDKKTEELLLRGRTDLLAEIRDLRKGRKAMRGYNTRVPRAARFFDGQG